VRDQVFTGSSVAEAVSEAARTLAVSEAALRYVVLDAGTPSRLGLAATPARIAVMLDSGRRAAAALEPEREVDVRTGIRDIVDALVHAADVEIEVEFRDDAEAFNVSLGGPGCGFLLDDDAEALESLDHLLQHSFGRHVAPRRLVVECGGRRQRRDAALRGLAEELAAEVQASGEPRQTRPLNSYERRIIHMVVGEMPGLRTFSVGEGGDRRVTIAPAEAAEPAGEPEPE